MLAPYDSLMFYLLRDASQWPQSLARIRTHRGGVAYAPICEWRFAPLADPIYIAPHDSPLTQLQSVADDDSFLQGFTDKNDFVPFSDVQILSRFVSLIGARGHAFRVQNVRTTISSQLREGPVVLIGALNNDWTLNRTSLLRFHLAGPEGADQVYWIADT